ncbi:hypothetical protein ACFW17_18695 [Streptomyces sp. NPDC058961]|uniref:hypothetical protein n=1 Tax=Streptomyces sp. NPDC058961 TaxID=3346680 RepID=UPI0036C42610
MTTTPPDAPASRLRYQVLGFSAAGAAVVLLIAGLAEGCTAISGGTVRSEAQFLQHVRDTEAAGEGTVLFLGSNPSSVTLGTAGGSASCVDDLGVDGDGVTRDQPSVSWAPGFADGDAGYRAAVDRLREHWSSQGWKVTVAPGTDPVTGRDSGLQAIRTTDDHGIALSLRPGRHTGEGLVVADGGCVRHNGSWDAASWRAE